jgi:ankyrin repeat protein
VNKQDGDGWTQLWWAAERGEEAEVKGLLAGGANAEIPDAYGGTPVWQAAACGKLGAVKLLVGAGASLTAAPHRGVGKGLTPLMIAVNFSITGGCPAECAALATYLKGFIAEQQGTHPPTPPPPSSHLLSQ